MYDAFYGPPVYKPCSPASSTSSEAPRVVIMSSQVGKKRSGKGGKNMAFSTGGVNMEVDYLDMDLLEEEDQKLAKNLLKKTKQARTGRARDAMVPLDESHQMIREILEKANPSVKEMRRIIPKMRALVYREEEEYRGKKKPKHQWDRAPDNWPSHIPFVDPNNGDKTDTSRVGKGKGKGANSQNSKPQKDQLHLMYDFLKGKYLEMYGCEQPKPQVQQQPNLYHPTEEQDHNSQLALKMEPQVTLPGPAHVAEPPLYTQSKRIINQDDEAQLVMSNLEMTIQHLLNEDFPGLREKLQGLHSVLKTILVSQEVDIFLKAGNEANQFLQQTSSANKKNEDWSDLYMSCQAFIEKWAFPKAPPKKLNIPLGKAPFVEETSTPVELKAFNAIEHQASLMNVELRVQTQGKPFLPDNLLKEEQDPGWITSPAKEMEEQTLSIQKPDIPPLFAPVQDLGVVMRQLPPSTTENCEKKEADLEKKRPDMKLDNQNFPQDATSPTHGLETSCEGMECGLESVLDGILSMEAEGMVTPNTTSSGGYCTDMTSLMPALQTHSFDTSSTEATTPEAVLYNALSVPSSGQGSGSVLAVTQVNTMTLQGTELQQTNLDPIANAMELAGIVRLLEEGIAVSSLPAELLVVPPAPQLASTQIVEPMDVTMMDDEY